MNINTGEIRTFDPGALIPEGFTPLGNLPDGNCPKCKGKGHTGRIVINPSGGYGYRPCECTNPESK